MTSDFWTTERIAELTRLWVEGLTTTEIAMRLGLGIDGKNAVVGKAHRLHLPARPNPIRRSGSNGPKGPKRPPRPRAAPAAGGGTPQPRVVRHTSYAARAAACRGGSSGAMRTPGSIRAGFEAALSKTRACQFPLWDKERPTQAFCGQPALLLAPDKPSAYCPEHHARCCVAPPGRQAKAEEAA